MGPRSKDERIKRPLKAPTVLLHTALEQARKWKLISETRREIALACPFTGPRFQ
jgi:hypothetical protein